MRSISAIVPVRNGAAFIEEALRSILSQSRPPQELIVVDDASTDGTIEIVRRAAPEARVLRGEERGAAAARHLGIVHAVGDLVAFLDHDDRWTPDHLRLHAAPLDADESLDAVLGTTQWMVRRGHGDAPDEGDAQAENLLLDDLAAPMPPFVPHGEPFPAMSFGALVVRRTAFDRVGAIDSSRRFGEDVAWFASARARGLRLRLELTTAQLHRRHGGNMTADAAANRRGFFDALRAGARARQEIAVVISVRNGARFIEHALQSVAAQTRAPAEVIVIDGRSDDGTREIVSRYPFARVLLREPLGVADANNAGIAATRSPLVAFLSHDDRWHPRKLEWQSARLAAEPSLDFVVGKARFELSPGCAAPPGFRSELLERPVPAFILETLLVRRDALVRVGPFDTALRSAEDVDWFSRARHLGVRGEAIDEIVVHKRVHDRNTSLDAEANTARLLRVLHSAVRRAKRTEPVP